MRTRRAEKSALAVVALVYVFLTFLTYDHIEEDAFVYFRQAVMIADGHGFVFNRGGEPVEASSSLLWLLLLVGLEWASVDLVLGAKVAGCALGVANLVVTHRLASSCIADPRLRLLAPAVLAVSTPFVMNAQRGLETPLFGLLLALLCLCCTESRLFRLWWIAAAALLPARPEGFLALLALVPVFWMRRDEWRDVVRGAAALGGVALVLLAARFLYFHDFVPNPFYIKMRLEGWLGARRVHWLFYGNHLYLFALPLLATVRDRAFWTPGRVALASFTAVQIGWTVLAKDYMPFYRHMAPALPLLFVLIASGLDRIASKGRIPRAAMLVAGAAWIALTAWASRSVGYFQRDFDNPIRTALVSFAEDPVRHASAMASKMRRPFAPTALDPLLEGTATIGNTYQALVGEFLRRNYPEGAVIVYDQMGQTPFYAGPDKVFLDSFGLTDRTVARHYFDRGLEESGGGSLRSYARLLDAVHAWLPGDGRRGRSGPVGSVEVLDYLFGREPDLVLINTFLTMNTPYSVTARLRADPRLARDYFLRYTLDGFVEVYERAGRPLRSGPLDVPPGLTVREH